MPRLSPNRLVLVVAALAVVAVAGFAAVVSYSHFFSLGRMHGQDGTSARLTPLSVDLLILAASLVLLWAARNSVNAPWPIRAVLVASVAATVAGNVADGLADGWLAALLNGWPGAAFVAAIEMLMWLVRASRDVARREGGQHVPGGPPAADGLLAAQAAYAASVTAGNPLSQNRIQERFRLTRAEARKVREGGPVAVAELVRASMNGAQADG
jgi:hypothetical protein